MSVDQEIQPGGFCVVGHYRNREVIDQPVEVVDEMALAQYARAQMKQVEDEA